MAWRDDAPPEAATPAIRGSPTRWRLLALLGGLPAMECEVVGAGRSALGTAGLGFDTDPIRQRIAEFQVLLDRHAAALVHCDRLEAKLIEQMGYPRVPVFTDWEGARRYATDADAIADAVPPGRHRRRLQRVLQRRRQRWDEAAEGAGLTAAKAQEATLDEDILDHADGLLATPAQTIDAVVLKLLVLLSTREPGPSAYGTSPWREVRLILSDLRGLMASRGSPP